MIDDGDRVAQALGDGLLVGHRQRRRRAFDRARIRLQPEQAGADLVVQFQRRAPPLVILRGDKLTIERQILRVRARKCAGERVEALGDGGELARLRARHAHIVTVPLQVGQTAGERGEWAEHAAEQNVQNGNHRHIEQDHRACGCRGVLPELGDFIARFADALDLANLAAIDGDLTVRVSTGGATSLANQRGAAPRAEAESAEGVVWIGTPAASLTMIRTWRRERNCNGRSATNCSAGRC